VTTNPPARLSSVDLTNLMNALVVEVVALTEIRVGRGFRAEMGKHDAPGIHYNLKGFGRITVGSGHPQPLAPHMLIIVPPNTPFSIDVFEDAAASVPPRLVSAECHRLRPDGVMRIAVDHVPPEVIQICGFFDASYGASAGLFRDLPEPLFQQFDASDGIDVKLRDALLELVAQEIGAGAMTASLLKQVIVSLIRKSIAASDVWGERFLVFSDRQIARAFSDMAARPGAAHTVASLAGTAGLSRSAFMARFTQRVGKSPMVALRDLRMRQASRELALTSATVDRISQNAGYESRSSFVRAFQKLFDRDPTEYRAYARARSAASMRPGNPGDEARRP
jgi:AraC family transcriptional regulator, activator of mtrCDE